MKHSDRGSWVASGISGICVLAAIVLLLKVCGNCYPEMVRVVRDVLGGVDNSPVREAFRVMEDGLEAGASIRDTVKETVQVIFEKTN